jgi:hypothetical protein
VVASFHLRAPGNASDVRAAHREGAGRLQEMATGWNRVVEIGVAERVSALALRDGMAEDGTLHLVDPFHLSRIPALNFMKRVAQRTVNGSSRRKVVWTRNSDRARRGVEGVHRF